MTCYACANESRRAHRSPEGLLCTTCVRFMRRREFSVPTDEGRNGPVTSSFDKMLAASYGLDGPTTKENFRSDRREAVTGW